MAAKVKVLPEEVVAECRGYHWTSTDKDIEGYLNSLLDPWGPSGSDPNPDYTAALQAVELLGGKVVVYDRTESVENVVY